MRSLSERFAYRVIAIEETCDLNTVTLKELMCSLQTSELNLKMNKKEKSISFQVEQHDSSKGNMNDDEFVVLLTKNFNSYLKKMNKKKKPQGSGKANNLQKNKKASNTVENKKLRKGIQCRECEGFDHI